MDLWRIKAAAVLALRGAISYPFRSEVLAMRSLPVVAGVVLMLTAAGCDPVVNVAGAEFPGWLLCAAGGAGLAALCHPLLVAAGLERELYPLPLFYGALITLFALSGWIILFSRA
jgi:YtcA family